MKSIEPFTPREREALALWQAESPAVGFADRVLHEALAAGVPAGPSVAAPVRAARGMAAAAVVMLALGGLLSLRSLMPPAGAGSEEGQPAGYLASPDGGPRPEVNLDGVEARSS